MPRIVHISPSIGESPRGGWLVAGRALPPTSVSGLWKRRALWLGAIGLYRRAVRGVPVNLSAAGRESVGEGDQNLGPRARDILLMGAAGYGGGSWWWGNSTQNLRGGISCTMRRGWRRGCLWEDRALPPDLWGRTSCTIARWVVREGVSKSTSHFDLVGGAFVRAGWGPLLTHSPLSPTNGRS